MNIEERTNNKARLITGLLSYDCQAIRCSHIRHINTHDISLRPQFSSCSKSVFSVVKSFKPVYAIKLLNNQQLSKINKSDLKTLFDENTT